MAEFDDLKTAGENYLMHYGVLGMKWGVRKGDKYTRSFNRDMDGVRIRKVQALRKNGQITKEQYKKELKDIRDKAKARKKKLSSGKNQSLENFKKKYNKPSDYLKEQESKAEKKRPGYNDYRKYRRGNRARNVRNVALGMLMAEAAGIGFARVRKTKQPEVVNPDAYRDIEQYYNKKYSMKHDDLKAAGEAFLAHHGVEGQQWGVKNGPPYPLEGAGKKSFIQQRKEVRAEKRRKKILKDPKKLAKYSDEFTPEEINEALKKIDAVDNVKKRIPKKNKLTRSEKRKARDPATLSKNIDKFDSDTFKMALDRLQKQRDAWDMAIKDAKRPADILGVGNAYLNEITSGIGKLKSGTGDIIGLHDNIMLIGKNGKTLKDQYKDKYGSSGGNGPSIDDIIDELKKQGYI